MLYPLELRALNYNSIFSYQFTNTGAARMQGAALPPGKVQPIEFVRGH